MKSHDTTSDRDVKPRATATATRRKIESAGDGPASPEPITQHKHTDMINGSPYMVSQRKRLRGLSGQTVQKQTPPEEEELMQGKLTAQRQVGDEEELMQGKFAAQRQPLEDEELMQGKFAAQRQPLEDEELMQGKFTAQMQPEEEELMQGKFAAQRQPLEDEELMQGKFTAQMQPEEEEELLQGKFKARPSAALEAGKKNLLQRKTKQPDENKTGIPDALKAGLESTLNTDFSQVRVHPNSSKATGVGALAYTQGTDVHFAPGQFKPDSSEGRQLLGHELTHVVQQSQGRVQPTGEVAGLPVNDSPVLEKEADEMGAKVPKHKP